jgi:hypothetical protein
MVINDTEVCGEGSSCFFQKSWGRTGELVRGHKRGVDDEFLNLGFSWH